MVSDGGASMAVRCYTMVTRQHHDNRMVTLIAASLYSHLMLMNRGKKCVGTGGADDVLQKERICICCR